MRQQEGFQVSWSWQGTTERRQPAWLHLLPHSAGAEEEPSHLMGEAQSEGSDASSAEGHVHTVDMASLLATAETLMNASLALTTEEGDVDGQSSVLAAPADVAPFPVDGGAAEDRESTVGPPPAPWITLCSQQRAILAMCLCANARVVEFHLAPTELSSGPSTPLLTVEGTEAAPGVFFHYVMNDGVQPLLPAGTQFHVKLFGRRPKHMVQVRCLCVLLGPSPSPETDDSRSFAEPTNAAEVGAASHTPRDTTVRVANTPATGPAGTPSPELAVLLGIQSALLHVSAQMGHLERRVEAMDDRLSAVEARVGRLENGQP